MKDNEIQTAVSHPVLRVIFRNVFYKSFRWRKNHWVASL